MSSDALRLLLAFDERVQREREQSPAVLHRRDRRFALESEQRGEPPDPARWLAHVNSLGGLAGVAPESPADPLRPWRQLQRTLLLAGLVFGGLCVYGLLVYEGTQRINLTLIVALVALQLALALSTAVQAGLGWQPWRLLKPRFLRAAVPPAAMQPLQPLLLGRAAQLGGLGFGLGGLAVLLAMILLQDLAFGWSTTLATGAESYHRFMQALSTPWSGLWPAAVPELSLVEATRFYRVEPSGPVADAQRWGQWWPFVVALWSSYVILPRCLLAGLAELLLQWRARRALRLHPGLQALQARMQTPVVETSVLEAEEVALPPADPAAAGLVALPAQGVLLCWAGAGQPVLPAPLQALAADAQRVGGSATLAADAQAIAAAEQQLQQMDSAARTAILLVRAWEPPTGELADFIAQALAAWPAQTRLVLALESLQQGQMPPAHLQAQWRHFVARNAEQAPGLLLGLAMASAPQQAAGTSAAATDQRRAQPSVRRETVGR